jgi:hypothetical protein
MTYLHIKIPKKNPSFIVNEVVSTTNILKTGVNMYGSKLYVYC